MPKPFVDISDCIAMSETADWYSFPKAFTRGQVMAALAREEDWWEAIHGYEIRAGHVRTGEFGEGLDWWQECGPDSIGAEPCWIVRRRRG